MEKDECICMALTRIMASFWVGNPTNNREQLLKYKRYREKDNNCTTTAGLATAKVEKSGTLR